VSNPFHDRRSSSVASVAILVVLCTALRLWFWRVTGLTLEDSLITFRYADNLAAGNGFVYNIGERVLGTTTPLWTMILAGIRYFTKLDVITAGKLVSIIFDAGTLILVWRCLTTIDRVAAHVWGLLFATAPLIVPISVSGMETSLLLLCMSAGLHGVIFRNILYGPALAFTILTRIDGVLYAGILAAAGLLRDGPRARRHFVVALALCGAWFGFSYFYFGSLLPQSLLAKRALYRFDVAGSAAPFIHEFTPVGESSVLRIAVRCAFLLLLCLGLVRTLRTGKSFLPVPVFFILYCLVFMASATVIFQWYLVPAAWAACILLALGAAEFSAWLRARLRWTLLRPTMAPAVAVFLCAANLVALDARSERLGQLQDFEDHLRKKIGLWLRDNAPEGSEVLLEPLGYIGYYAGPSIRVRDEIGLVSPAILALRRETTGWYTLALRRLKPAYVVQYASALDENLAEGTRSPLFLDQGEREWFELNYGAAETFDVLDRYPQIEAREKKFILFRRRAEIPEPGQMDKGELAGGILAPQAN